jgi:hypothetical protein
MIAISESCGIGEDCVESAEGKTVGEISYRVDVYLKSRIIPLLSERYTRREYLANEIFKIIIFEK